MISSMFGGVGPLPDPLLFPPPGGVIGKKRDRRGRPRKSVT